MPTSNHTLGLTPEELRQGLATYPDATRELLHWSYGYATTLGALAPLAAQLGYEAATIRRIWQGSAVHCTEAFLDRVRELRTRVARQKIERFAETEITRAIWRACDLALREGEIVAIVGPTGSGKSATLQQWQAANNHGRAIYVDCPVPCRLRTLANELALQMGFTSKMSNKGHEVLDLLVRSFTSRNVIVLDEIGRLLPQGRGHDVSALEFVRRLHDRNGVGLVLSMTYTSHQEIVGGAMRGYLEQLLGRFADVVEIGPQPLESEAEAIVRAFVPDASAELIEAVGQYAASGQGRWRPTVRLLDRALRAAAREQQPLTLEFWHAAVAHRAGQKQWQGAPIKPRQIRR
jgi:hypothetical protein